MRDRLDDYLGTGDHLRAAIKKAEEASTLSGRAIEIEENDPAEAIRIWKILLGEFFPAYGYGL